MLKRKTVLLTICIMVLISSTAAATNLSIGQQNYNLRVGDFNSSAAHFTLISVGYGQDKYSGFAAEIFSGDGSSGLEVEYQFIPQAMRQRRNNFNYAAKIGAVSGDYWEDDSSGLKAGFVIERQINQKSEVYFDADIINTSAMIMDGELGFCGELAPGIMGILGYKVVTHEDYDTIDGVHFGLKIDF
ncbi:MAG: hypothetical protein ACQERJ_02645 [Bacillota bacterium]